MIHTKCSSFLNYWRLVSRELNRVTQWGMRVSCSALAGVLDGHAVETVKFRLFFRIAGVQKAHGESSCDLREWKSAFCSVHIMS